MANSLRVCYFFCIFATEVDKTPFTFISNKYTFISTIIPECYETYYIVTHCTSMYNSCIIAEDIFLFAERKPDS